MFDLREAGGLPMRINSLSFIKSEKTQFAGLWLVLLSVAGVQSRTNQCWAAIRLNLTCDGFLFGYSQTVYSSVSVFNDPNQMLIIF